MKRRLRPLVSRSRSELLSRVEPYLFVEAHTERLFWKYLGSQADAIRNIVIVGAWQGAEIGDLLRQYRAASIVAFEPSRLNYQALSSTYAGQARVQCFEVAISDRVGEAEFHEASLAGSGSLLPLASDEGSRSHNRGLTQQDSFTVPVSTLDEHEATRNLDHVDLLKIDVQGVEAAVLRGGRGLTAKTSAVLVEVALSGSAYRGATQFTDVDGLLRDGGLTLCGLGLDPVTLDGNALYVRTDARQPG